MDLEPYFEDLDFWTSGEDTLIQELAEKCKELDEIRMQDERALRKVLMLVSELGDIIFDSITWRSPFVYVGSYGDTYGGESAHELSKSYKHYLMSAGIVERASVKKNREEHVFMFMHFHACEALESAGYLERAELFMKEKLLEWIKKSKDVIYGIIFIGGKMAMYLMGKETQTFSRLLSGTPFSAVPPVEPGFWRPIADKSGLEYLLRIFMKEWFEIDERGFRKEIALRPVIENGLKRGESLTDITAVEEEKWRSKEAAEKKESSSESGSSPGTVHEDWIILDFP